MLFSIRSGLLQCRNIRSGSVLHTGFTESLSASVAVQTQAQYFAEALYYNDTTVSCVVNEFFYYFDCFWDTQPHRPQHGPGAKWRLTRRHLRLPPPAIRPQTSDPTLVGTKWWLTRRHLRLPPPATSYCGCAASQSATSWSYTASSPLV